MWSSGASEWRMTMLDVKKQVYTRDLFGCIYEKKDWNYVQDRLLEKFFYYIREGVEVGKNTFLWRDTRDRRFITWFDRVNYYCNLMSFSVSKKASMVWVFNRQRFTLFCRFEKKLAISCDYEFDYIFGDVVWCSRSFFCKSRHKCEIII